MTPDEFSALLQRLTAAADAGDGEAFAGCFTADAVYHDYIYGDHAGRTGIAQMITGLFHRDAQDYRWEMFDPVCNGSLGYARYLFRFTSRVPEFAGQRVVVEGISRFELKDGLISDYSESVNGGVAMAQLGVKPERMAKIMQRWSRQLLERPATRDFLARGTRASTGTGSGQ